MMDRERLNELHAKYREQHGIYEGWHPTLEEAERTVRECLLAIDDLVRECDGLRILLNQPLYQPGPLTVTIAAGTYEYDPNTMTLTPRKDTR